jgi:UDP:flavonoid glycosyltransferase YjiC (YdhE family)
MAETLKADSGLDSRVDTESEVMGERILVVTAGLSGLLYSSVELARRLAKVGHHVTYAGPATAHPLAEQHDLGFLALPPSQYDQFLEADATAGAIRRLVELRRRRQRAAESMAVGGFVTALRQLDPGLVLIDGEMHEHIIAASGTGAPVALLNTFASIWRRPGLPPPHHLARPGFGWKGTRLGMWMLWLELRLRKQQKAALHGFRRVGCDRLSILRHLGREADFDLRRETDDSQWLIPFNYRRIPVLSLHALEFEFPHSPPDRVHYVGPMVLEPRNDRPMPPEDKGELEAVFEWRRRGEGRRRLVYVGFGSVFSSDLDLVRRLVGAVEMRPDWKLIISLSDRVTRDEIGRLPPGAHAFPWTPQLRALRQADACVTHGGINTIDECVLSGVPLLVYCGFETDMAGNTARVVHHGIGIAGDRDRDTTETIVGHVERLMSEPTFDQNLQRLRRDYEAYAENRVAERVVESLLHRLDSASHRNGSSSPDGDDG